jgi:inward rectifier potassium channel
MATVGYGVMSPATIYGHTVASLEIIFGMMTIAVITGLVFTRFSRPRGRLLFSRLAVVAPVDGVPTVMLRVVNERNEALADATARMLLLRSHVTSEGTTIRRFVDLPLVRSSTPMLGLSWTLMHVIDEKSPLLGATMESLAAESGFLLVSLSGYDESISASITARRSYRATDLRFGYRLVDVMDISPTGTTVLDMRRFHDVEPVHAGESANPQIS